MRWDAILQLLGDEEPAAAAADEDAPAADVGAALTAVVGSSDGAALRKAFNDVDAADLVARLVSRSGRDVRRRGAMAICTALDRTLLPRKKRVAPAEPAAISLSAAGSRGLARASSPASRRLEKRQKRWQRKMTAYARPRRNLPSLRNPGFDGRLAKIATSAPPLLERNPTSAVAASRGIATSRGCGAAAASAEDLHGITRRRYLVRSHVNRQLRHGWRGAATFAKLTYFAGRVLVGGVVRFLGVAVRRVLERLMPGFDQEPAAA